MCEQQYPRLRVTQKVWDVIVEISPDISCNTGHAKQEILSLKMGDGRWGIGCVWWVERVGTEVFKLCYSSRDCESPYYFSESEVKHA
jgi:hypothetical protein